ncbi:MAG: ribosome maturation factor RimP, partial [Oscillospiraceae bacterium]|nr:ribosome maturation factor RimP [Oscillospiraceae bacterium]
LRVFIDKEGGVNIDDCENVSRATDPLIDAAEPISQAYYYEVSSPGIGRDLVRPWHFDKYMGQDIEIRLIRAENKQRDFMGALLSYDDASVTIRVGEEEKTFMKKDCAFIRLYEEINL